MSEQVSNVAEVDGGERSRAAATGSSPGGWYRVDDAGLVRGWVTDRSARARRLTVTILVDGAAQGEAVADRFDRSLLDRGEGDGRYGFAWIVPAHLRDGASHRVEVFASELGFPLKTKAGVFRLGPDDPAARLVVEAVEPHGVRGRLQGAGLAPAPLEVWSKGRRVAGPLPTRWRETPTGACFETELPLELVLRHGPEAVLALPGMLEAGWPAPAVDISSTLSAEQDSSGQIRLALTGPPMVLQPFECDVALRSGEGSTVARRAEFRDGVHVLAGPVLSDSETQVELLVGDEGSSVARATVMRKASQLLRNGEFAEWDGASPRGWRVEGASADRSFFAFPLHLAERHELSGHCLSLLRGEAPAVLEQELTLGSPARIEELSFLGRSSAPATVRVEVLRAAETVVTAAVIELSGDEEWTEFRQFVDTGLVDDLVLRLTIEGRGGQVEMTNLCAAGYGIALRDLADVEVRSAVNFVASPSLSQWPRGVVVACGPGRTEIAWDWCVNCGGASDAVARPATPDNPSAEVGLLLDARVRDRVQVEARLLSVPKDEPELVLTFDAGLAAEADAEFGVIDRIKVVRRVFADGGHTDIESITLGRRLLLSRSSHRFELAAPLIQAAPPGAKDRLEEAQFLVFDFRESLRIQLGQIALRTRGGVAAVEPPRLELEDPNVRDQAAHLVGFQHWLQPGLIHPREPSAPERPPCERWSPLPSGDSLDVIVVVEDVQADLMRTLSSALRAIDAPHVLTIVFDDQAVRIAELLHAFAADRPWVRLKAAPAGENVKAVAALLEASDAPWAVLIEAGAELPAGFARGLVEVGVSRMNLAAVGPLSNDAAFQSIPELPSDVFAAADLPPDWDASRMAALVASSSERAYPTVDFLDGGCVMLSRKALRQIGGLRVRDRTVRAAVQDFCLRSRKRGMELALADHLYVYRKPRGVHDRRRSLGEVKLANPAFNFPALLRSFRDQPALARMRARVRAVYQQTNASR